MSKPVYTPPPFVDMFEAAKVNKPAKDVQHLVIKRRRFVRIVDGHRLPGIDGDPTSFWEEEP